MTNIRLQSSDGQIFNTDEKIAKLSGTIKTLLEGFGIEDGDDNGTVPLPNVNSAILSKVLEWATHHKDDAVQIDDKNKESRTDDISSWDAEFLDVDQATLFEVILAANYLDIKGLFEVSCKAVANMIKGKSSEEIRRRFYFKKGFSAEKMEH